MRASFHTFFPFLSYFLHTRFFLTNNRVSLLTRKPVQLFIYYGRMFITVSKSDVFLIRVQNSYLLKYMSDHRILLQKAGLEIKLGSSTENESNFSYFFFVSVILLTYSFFFNKQNKIVFLCLLDSPVQVFIYYRRMFNTVCKSDVFLIHVQKSYPVELHSIKNVVIINCILEDF